VGGRVARAKAKSGHWYFLKMKRSMDPATLALKCLFLMVLTIPVHLYTVGCSSVKKKQIQSSVISMER
jgi:hypothetical protein